MEAWEVQETWTNYLKLPSVLVESYGATDYHAVRSQKGTLTLRYTLPNFFNDTSSSDILKQKVHIVYKLDGFKQFQQLLRAFQLKLQLQSETFKTWIFWIFKIWILLFLTFQRWCFAFCVFNFLLCRWFTTWQTHL